jgi:hypothetical protein
MFADADSGLNFYSAGFIETGGQHIGLALRSLTGLQTLILEGANTLLVFAVLFCCVRG